MPSDEAHRRRFERLTAALYRDLGLDRPAPLAERGYIEVDHLLCERPGAALDAHARVLARDDQVAVKGIAAGIHPDDVARAQHTHPGESSHPAPDKVLRVLPGGQRRRFGKGEGIWNRQAVRRRSQAVFGVTAARRKRADDITDFPICDVSRFGGDFPGYFQPQDGRCVRRRRIRARPLQNIRTVYSGVRDFNQYTAGLKRRQGAVFQAHNCRRTALAMVNVFHGCGN